MTEQPHKKRFWKNRKLNVFLFFLLLSFLFSMLTKFSGDLTKSLSLEIKPVNIPEDKMIIKDSLHKLEINLTTYGFKMARFFINPPKVEIDMAKLDEKGHFLIWTQQKGYSDVVSQFEQNVQINTVNPDSLFFQFDQNTVKSVPVKLEENIEFKAGFDLIKGFTLEPDSVKVIGPSTMVDTIKLVKTVPLNLNNISESIDLDLDLIRPSNSQLRLSQPTVNIRAEVGKFTEGEIYVPVIITNLPENVRVTIYPKEVPVVFYASLDKFDKIASSGFIVECDFNQVGIGQSYLVPRLVDYPDDIKNVRLGIKRIEFITSE